MTDHMDAVSRSALMSRIRGKHTRPELAVRRMAHRMGLRFRLHRKDLPGTPDLVFPSRRTIGFVHGCFWHRHPGCTKASNTKTRTDYWQAKFDRNVARDAELRHRLEQAGWHVVTIWECETRDPAVLESWLREIVAIPHTAPRRTARSSQRAIFEPSVE